MNMFRNKFGKNKDRGESSSPSDHPSQQQQQQQQQSSSNGNYHLSQPQSTGVGASYQEPGGGVSDHGTGGGMAAKAGSFMKRGGKGEFVLLYTREYH